MSDIVEDLQEVVDILQPSPLVSQIYRGIAEIKRLRKDNLRLLKEVQEVGPQTKEGGTQ